MISRKAIILNRVKRFVKDRTPFLYFLYRRLKFHKQKKALRKHGLEALLKIKETTHELGIKYWLDFGTLLGAIRDGDFIYDDLDLDIGMFLDEYTPNLEHCLSKKGFRKIECFLIDKGNYGRKEAYSYKGVVVDIFFYTRTGNYIYCHGFRARDDKNLIEMLYEEKTFLVREVTFPFNGLTNINFLGHHFSIPKNYDSYLKAYYGENYLRNDRNWNSSMAKNVKVLNDKEGEWCGHK